MGKKIMGVKVWIVGAIVIAVAAFYFMKIKPKRDIKSRLDRSTLITGSRPGEPQILPDMIDKAIVGPATPLTTSARSRMRSMAVFRGRRPKMNRARSI